MRESEPNSSLMGTVFCADVVNNDIDSHYMFHKFLF